MTEEHIKAYAVKQFPNDEFKQWILIHAINWATKELEKENNRLKEQVDKMKCCQNCEIFTYHNFASCGESILIDKSHGTYICDKWKLREKWDENDKL